MGLAGIWFFLPFCHRPRRPTDVNRWAAYALLTVLLPYPSPQPMQTGWCSRNSNTVRTRTVSAALYNIAVELSLIISSNIYRKHDWPEYRRENGALVGIARMNAVVYVGVKGDYV